MPYQPAANIISVELRMLWDNQKIENVFHFRPVSGTAAAALQTAADLVANWYVDAYRFNLTSTVQLRETYATDLTTATGGVYTSSIGASSAGSSSAQSCPNNVAVCVTHRTAARGRTARGRTYVPGVPKTGVLNNTIDSAYATGIASTFFALRQDAAAEGLEFGILSRQEDNVKRASALFRPIISSVILDLTVDSMRRRLPGRGT